MQPGCMCSSTPSREVCSPCSSTFNYLTDRCVFLRGKSLVGSLWISTMWFLTLEGQRTLLFLRKQTNTKKSWVSGRFSFLTVWRKGFGASQHSKEKQNLSKCFLTEEFDQPLNADKLNSESPVLSAGGPARLKSTRHYGELQTIHPPPSVLLVITMLTCMSGLLAPGNGIILLHRNAAPVSVL